MSDVIKLTIDGKKVNVPEGTNLIEAAKTVGVEIPNLCFFEGGRGVGACRLCLVEIEGGKAPVTACTTRVKEGMNVSTGTERVVEARKFVIDLLLSMHPLDCMTCVKAGVCDLQRYAYELGIQESSFTRKHFDYPRDEANPFIKRDPDYCILCGKCVRACQQQGTNVIDFMGRGVGAKVTTAGDKPLQESGCTFCGSCVDACPVNALLEADRWRKGREWEYTKASSVCLSCGNGCDISVFTKAGEVVKISAGGADGSIDRYICAIGRFGFDSIKSKTRLASPMIRVNQKLKKATWEEANAKVAAALKKAGGKTGFLATGGLLNEDALALKMFATDVVGTKNVDTTVSLYADTASMIGEGGDLEAADLVVLAGLDPSQWTRVLPALDVALRRKVLAKSKLIVLNAKKTRIAEVAALVIEGDEGKALKALASDLKDKNTKNEAALLYRDAENPLLLCAPGLFSQALEVSAVKGTSVAVPLEANAKGVGRLGLAVGGMTYSDIASGQNEVLYVVGEPLLDKRPKVGTLIVQADHLTKLAETADIVLPSAAWLEDEGTIVDCLGRSKRVNRAVDAPGEAKSHRDIFSVVAKAMGSSLKAPSEADIKKAFETQSGTTVSSTKNKTSGTSPEEIICKTNQSLIDGSRLSWLEEGV